MAKKTKTPTVEDAIVAHMKDNGQSMTWLADKLGITPNHLHYVLKGNPPGNSRPVTKRVLTGDNLEKINIFLKTSFELEPVNQNHS